MRMKKETTKKYKKSGETLENQLHKQYAENDNSRTKVFTSFIIGIVALFGFYGYVFVNTNNQERFNFNMQEFLLMSFITMGILFFLVVLALNLGYALRRDHLIVYNIRKKRYKKKTKMKKIFGKIYNPRDKKFCDFIPGFYNLFYWLFFCSEIFIFITTIIKICGIKNNDITQFCKYGYILYPVMLFHILFIILVFLFRIHYYYNKYKVASNN